MLDVPSFVERGLVNEELHRGGTHKSVYTYIHDKWQVRPNITLDLGLRHEVYTPLVGYTAKGGQMAYDSDEQHGSRGGVWRRAREPGREDLLEELQPAHGYFVAHCRRQRAARRLRRQRAALAELLRSGLSDQTDSAVNGHQRLRAGRRAGDRHADAGVRGDSRQRHPRRDRLARRGAGRSADRSSRGAAALVERRLSASSARRVHGRSGLRRQSRRAHPAEHRSQRRVHARRR